MTEDITHSGAAGASTYCTCVPSDETLVDFVSPLVSMRMDAVNDAPSFVWSGVLTPRLNTFVSRTVPLKSNRNGTAAAKVLKDSSTSVVSRRKTERPLACIFIL